MALMGHHSSTVGPGVVRLFHGAYSVRRFLSHPDYSYEVITRPTYTVHYLYFYINLIFFCIYFPIEIFK